MCSLTRKVDRIFYFFRVHKESQDLLVSKAQLVHKYVILRPRLLISLLAVIFRSLALTSVCS